MKTSNGIEVLKEGTDYITVQNSVDAGTGYIIFQGIHAYTGTMKKSFRITPYDFAADESQQMDFVIETNVPYTKGGAKPDVQVFFGNSSAPNYKDLQSENCLCCIHFIVCVYGKFADILLSYRKVQCFLSLKVAFSGNCFARRFTP